MVTTMPRNVAPLVDPGRATNVARGTSETPPFRDYFAATVCLLGTFPACTQSHAVQRCLQHGRQIVADNRTNTMPEQYVHNTRARLWTRCSVGYYHLPPPPHPTSHQHPHISSVVLLTDFSETFHQNRDWINCFLPLATSPTHRDSGLLGAQVTCHVLSWPLRPT
jgi:hypothetical protein